MKTLKVPIKDDKVGELVKISVWDDSVIGRDCGVEASKWFSTLCGKELQMVRMPDDEYDRPIPESKMISGSDNQVSYADGFPFLITSTRSLQDLNEVLKKNNKNAVPMMRFRPNIVVEGCKTPWIEDTWDKLSIGLCIFKNVKKCGRCRMTTVDQNQGKSVGKEPLETLKKIRAD